MIFLFRKNSDSIQGEVIGVIMFILTCFPFPHITTTSQSPTLPLFSRSTYPK
nr:MAG TPA: hypothetical protein [Caudoviricetes sp.]